MPKTLTLSPKEVFDRVRLSCQIPATVEKIITHEIVTTKAREANLEVTPEEIQQAADNWRSINQLQSVEDTWLWLKQHHISLDEFEELISASVLSSKLAQHLFSDRIEPYFLEYQADYARVAIHEIVLDDLDLAMELSYAIDEREISFFEAAYQYNSDTELRRRGGYRGVLCRKDLNPKISAAVFAAKPSQILKPIVTAEGVHLIRVEEIILPQLDEMLYQKILGDLFNNWLQQEMSKYEVAIDCNVFDSVTQPSESSFQESIPV